MGRSSVEVEIKLAFSSAEEARHRLSALGVELIRPRAFEDNLVYDWPSGALESSRRLLRLRRAGGAAWLTYKEPVEHEDGQHKVRRELETAVGDPEALDRILQALGLQVAYRYQKYRTLYAWRQLKIALDETPIGCYVELEGDPQDIERAARALGFSPRAYIRDTYRELHRAAVAAGNAPPGHLVFPAAGDPS